MPNPPVISPNQRFLLYGITYLLSTPSFLAQLVDTQGDVPQWLQTEAGITDASLRTLCLDFINTIKNATLPYAFMNATRNSLRVVGTDMPGMYDSSICPTRTESALILKTMSQINTASPLTPVAGKQLAIDANGGIHIRHQGNVTIALGDE